MQVQLTTEVPVFSVVLTPHHFHEHDDPPGLLPRALPDQGGGGGSRLPRTLASLAQLAAAA